MGLFEKQEAKAELPPFSVKSAKEIYELFRGGKDCRMMFLEDNVPYLDSEKVLEEIKSIEAEANLKVGGNCVITEAVYSEMDEAGEKEIISEAVYYKPTTMDDLSNNVPSELLDAKAVVADVVKYTPTYVEKRTWDEFKKGV